MARYTGKNKMEGLIKKGIGEEEGLIRSDFGFFRGN